MKIKQGYAKFINHMSKKLIY